MTTLNAPSAACLWNEYWDSDKSTAARNALIEHYLPLVRSAALRLASTKGRRAQQADLDDLLQYGVFGLKDAIRGFDPDRGFKFETYCLQRVRGAMLDGLKINQWLPRDIRKSITSYSAAHEHVMGEEGPGMHEDAIASRMGVSASAVLALENHRSRMSIASLHAADPTCATAVAPAEMIPDHREEEPAIALQRQTVRDLFLKELNRSERHLLMLYYYEELTMREIGEVLGISGTRVSQLHTEIVGRLREKFGGRFTTADGFAQRALDL